MGWTIGVLGFDSRWGLGIFLFTTASRPAPGPTQPPIQWVAGALSLGVKRSGREADHSPPPSAEVKGWVELYLHFPNTSSWRGAHLKHKDNVNKTQFYFGCAVVCYDWWLNIKVLIHVIEQFSILKRVGFISHSAIVKHRITQYDRFMHLFRETCLNIC
jgi:hypothetical protein